MNHKEISQKASELIKRVKSKTDLQSTIEHTNELKGLILELKNLEIKK